MSAEKPISNIIASEINENREIRTKSNIAILRQFKEGDFSLIKQYSGFGGLRKALKDAAIQQKLAEFLSPKEMESLLKSTRTGYFTPPLLINFIYQLVQKLGFSGGKILEPACGHGAFFEYMPKRLCENSKITGIELEPLSAQIAESLYPDIKILSQGFQHFQEKDFDLIVGNPPYAPFTVFDRNHPDLKEEMIHHYFVAKSVRLLKEGGLLAMVVPCYVLDNPKRHLRHQIAEVADLVAAYRMPENLFEEAKVTVDVVIFRRTAQPKKDWTETVRVQLANQKRFSMAKYFVDHPEHVLGELDIYQAYSLFEERPRKGLKCIGAIEAVQTRLPELVRALSI